MTTTEQVQRVGDILRREGVDMSPPAPGFSDWLLSLLDRLLDALNVLFPVGVELSWLGRPLLWILVALGVGAVGLFLVTVLRTPRIAERAGELSESSEVPSSPGVRQTDWRSALDSALARGDLAAALEATWWVLLDGVSVTSRSQRPRSDSSTGRAALRAAGRRDLLPLVRELEAMTYGRQPLRREVLEPLARRVCDSVA